MGETLDVADLEPGTVLMDKYRVVETIGVGGMGVVVACDHLSLEHRVAIKFLLPKYVSNEEVVRRFLQEARAAIKIKSDHVAQVIDVGLLEDERMRTPTIPYMVMEYLEGKDLSQWVELGKRFSVSEAIDYTVQAAEALAQAHREGIVHRDVKPANLFLAEHRRRKKRDVVKVLDFGISKSLDEDPKDMGLTKTTTVLGSGLYMSPEQMRSAKDVDFRTDIYSLGVCMYELLTGSQPYTAETFSELCVKVNTEPPTPVEDYRTDLPDGLAEVLASAYARDPGERYQTVQDFVGALAPFAATTSVPDIELVQGITENRESLTQPRMVDGPSGGAALAASAARGEPAPRSVGVILTTALGALVLAAGIAQYVLQSRQATTSPTTGTLPSAAPPGSQLAPGPSAPTTGAPSAAGSAEDGAAGDGAAGDGAAGDGAAGAGATDGGAAASATASTSAAPMSSGSAAAGPATCARLDPRTGTLATLPCQ
ncbi:MAG: serine/threonine protein kinase [Deltaproteobacteria bacterium]|nr:serine/threonine protein kinase [Deltaproteobacteria bacterium]